MANESLKEKEKILKQIAEIEERIQNQSRINKSTRDQYNKLLKDAARLNKASIDSNKMELNIGKDVRKLQSDIVKSNKSKLGLLFKGNVQGLLEQKNISKTLGLQIKVKQSQQKQATSLKALVNLGKISVEDRNKLMNLQKGISDGSIQESDIAEELNGLSKEGLKHRRAFTAIAMKNLKNQEELNEAEERSNELQEKLNASFAQGAAVFGVLSAIALKFGESIDKIGETFGSLSVMGKPFKKDLLDASVEATKLGGGIEDVASITNTLGSDFGISVDAAAELSGKVFDTSKAIGLSSSEAANLFGTLMQTANLSAEQAESLAEGAFQLARQNGVAPNAVMADIAGSAEEIAVFTKDGGENIAEAAVQARKMGLSLSTTAKIAEGLLDFESSIQNEIEASVLVGKQLNYQKARELALNNDIAGAVKSVVDQLGSEEEFNNLNAIARQSIAKSIGVSVAEMSKLVGQSDKLSLSGAMAAGNFEDLLGQDGISNISSLINKFKSLGATLINELGPYMESILGQLNRFLTEGKGIEKIAGIIQGLGSAFKFVANNLPTVIALMVAFKTISFGAAIASTIAAIAGSAAVTPLMLGAGGAIAGAAIIASYYAAKSALKVDDFTSGPGGITHMSGPAGSFELNPKDSVLATTNPIAVNDMMTGPAGSMGGNDKPQTINIVGNFKAKGDVMEAVLEGANNQPGYNSLQPRFG